MLHISIIASQGQHVYDGFHIQNVNNYASRLKRWIRRFNASLPTISKAISDGGA